MPNKKQTSVKAKTNLKDEKNEAKKAYAEKIMDKRVDGTNIEYLIKWKDLGE